MPLVLAGATSGSTTIQATDAVTQTITLPNATGTVLVTNGSGIASVNGIQFPATQSPSADANTLDDYEEGTWTPTLIGSTSGSATIGVLGASRYIKIGKQVTIWTDMQSINRNTLSGIVRFTLPFSAANTAGYPTGVMRYSGLTNMSTSTVVDPVVSPGTNYAFFQSKNGTSYVVADLVNTNFNAFFDIYMLTVTYEAA